MVEGVVSDTAIEERKRATSSRTITGGLGRITVYQPVITYSFKVDGRNFKASRYRNSWPGEWTDPSRSKVEGIVNEYPQGKKVMVHYDPSDPAQAYLVTEESDTGLVMTRLFGYVLLAGALVCLGLGISGLARNFIAKREIADIAKSKAAIPVPTSQIKNQLEDDLGLTCQQKAFPGVHIAYRGWSCKNSPDDMVPVVEIWSRLDEPEKVDLIWMITDQDNLEENKSLLTAVIATVFSGADA